MQAFWKGLGKTLMAIAHAAGQGALWASEHPEVVAAGAKVAARLAGHPEIAAAIPTLSKSS